MKLNFPTVFSWLLPVSLAGGSILLPIDIGGISFYLFRIAVFIGAFWGGIIFLNQYKEMHGGVKKYMAVLTVWLLVGLVSYLYVLDHSAWLKDVFYLIVGIAVYLSLIYIRENEKEEAFLYGWITGYLCNLLFGFFEMYSGNHFAGDSTHNLSLLSPEHYSHLAPFGFFGNPNHYAFYLVLSFLVFTKYRQLLTEKVFLLLLFPGIWQLFSTSSKFSIMAFLAIALYWIYLMKGEKSVRNKNFILMIPVGLLFFSILLLSLNFKTVSITNESEKARIELQKKNPDNRPTSGNMRRALLKNGISFVKESKGLGIGAGQFSVYILKGKAPYDSGHLSDPHNGILEIASQYGLIVILVLIWFYFDWIRNVFRYAPYEIRIFSLLILFSILILQNVNSGFISSPLTWFLLSFPVIWFQFKPLKKK